MHAVSNSILSIVKRSEKGSWPLPHYSHFQSALDGNKMLLGFVAHILKTIGYDNETSDLATNVTTACNLFESSDLLVTHQMH